MILIDTEAGIPKIPKVQHAQEYSWFTYNSCALNCVKIVFYFSEFVIQESFTYGYKLKSMQ